MTVIWNRSPFSRAAWRAARKVSIMAPRFFSPRLTASTSAACVVGANVGQAFAHPAMQRTVVDDRTCMMI
jgi:hypothetical protein